MLDCYTNCIPEIISICLNIFLIYFLICFANIMGGFLFLILKALLAYNLIFLVELYQLLVSMLDGSLKMSWKVFPLTVILLQKTFNIGAKCLIEFSNKAI